MATIARLSPHDVQGDVRHEVEHEDGDLVEGHPRRVNGVELLHGKLEPPGMQTMDQVMQQEAEPPDEQQLGIEDRASEKGFRASFQWSWESLLFQFRAY